MVIAGIFSMQGPPQSKHGKMITTRVQDGWRAWYEGEEEIVASHRNREEAMRLLKQKHDEGDILSSSEGGVQNS